MTKNLFAFIAFVAVLFVFTRCEKPPDIIPDSIDDSVSSKLMASFAKATYDDILYRDYEFPVLVCSNSEWKLAYSRQVGSWNPFVSDFWYQIYESDKAIVIAFRGTPPLSWNPTVWDNWKETFGLVLGNNHPQDEYVRKEVKNGEISEYLKKGKKIFITGHSLGGHLAMIAYLEIRKNYENLVGKVETFNAVGIQKGDADEIEKKGVNKIRQHYTCCDIANWGSQISMPGLVGKLYFPAVERPMKNITTNIDGSSHTHSTEQNWWDFEKASIGIEAHKIENFDYCDIGMIPTVNEVTFIISEAADISHNSATFSIDVTANVTVTDKGLCYSSQNNMPTTADSKISKGSGSGSYSVTLTDLTKNTSYSVRPYAIANGETYYGERKSFITDDDGIPDIIPPEILEDMKKLGLEIHGGNNPPLVEGKYRAYPHTFVNGNMPQGCPYKPGDLYYRPTMWVTFSGQNNANLTVNTNYSYEQGSTGVGTGSFITGKDNKFSIFCRSIFRAGECETITVVSGIINENNDILNFHYYVYCIKKVGIWDIRERESWLFRDGDGISEKY